MNDDQLTATDLAFVSAQFEVLGRELDTIGANDRRRMVGAIVAAIGRTSSVAVADLAAASALAVLTVRGAK